MSYISFKSNNEANNRDAHLIKRTLEDPSFDVNRTDGYKDIFSGHFDTTALNFCIGQGFADLTEKLLAHPKIDPFVLDHKGHDAAFYAVKKNDLPLLKRLVGFPGFNINRAYPEDTTLAMHASDDEVRWFLLTMKGHNLNQVSKGGWSLLKLAASYNDTKAMEFLLAEGTIPKVLKEAYIHALDRENVAAMALFLTFSPALSETKTVHGKDAASVLDRKFKRIRV